MQIRFLRGAARPARGPGFALRLGLLCFVLVGVGLGAGAAPRAGRAAERPSTQASHGWALFQERVSAAEAASAAQRWPEAARAWAAVVKQNPVTPNHWLALARARYRCDSLETALPAYRRAFALGAGNPASVAAVLARCQIRLGHPDSAWVWLDRALDLGYRDNEALAADTLFLPLHDDPRFRARLGWFEAGAPDRDAGWRNDLKYLGHEAHRRLWRMPERAARAFDARAARIDADIPRLTDMQVTLEFMRLLGSLGDGHTTVYANDERPELRRCLPVEFGLFEEGLAIVGASALQQALVGRRVLAIDGRDPAALLDSLDGFISRDNPMARSVMGPRRLRCVPLLHALGLAAAEDRVTLKLSDAEGRVTQVSLAAAPEEPPLGFHHGPPPGWVQAAELAPNRPLRHRSPGRPYGFERVPRDGALYFQWRRITDEPEGSWPRCVDSLFAEARRYPPRRFVIDLRDNHGGDTGLEATLLERLAADSTLNRPGRLYVLIGRETFSAAQNAANWLRAHTEAIFAGEPTGSSPNFVGEESSFTLPYSRLRVNVSDRYWQGGWPTDAAVWLAPRIYLPPTLAALRAGRDDLLDLVLSLP